MEPSQKWILENYLTMMSVIHLTICCLQAGDNDEGQAEDNDEGQAEDNDEGQAEDTVMMKDKQKIL
jgi:hypothetical protein